MPLTTADTFRTSGRVLGVGIDLCERDRIAALVSARGERFLRHVFTRVEQELIASRGAHHCAGLFAAKEAVVKCLGTGFNCGVGWRQVEIGWTGRRWNVSLSGEAARLDSIPGETTWQLDVQYTRDYAVAVAIWATASKNRETIERGTIDEPADRYHGPG